MQSSLNTVPYVGEGDHILPKCGFFVLQQLAGVDGMEGYELPIPVDPCLPERETRLTPARFTDPGLCSVHKQPSFRHILGQSVPQL